jgi:hypothetical protein
MLVTNLGRCMQRPYFTRHYTFPYRNYIIPEPEPLRPCDETGCENKGYRRHYSKK